MQRKAKRVQCTEGRTEEEGEGGGREVGGSNATQGGVVQCNKERGCAFLVVPRLEVGGPCISMRSDWAGRIHLHTLPSSV